MFIAILAFGVGVYVGYKYPGQVEQVMATITKTFNDLKDKITKKGPPSQSPPNP
jgi:hypothetical protein